MTLSLVISITAIVLAYRAGYLEADILRSKTKEDAIYEGVQSATKIYKSVMILNGLVMNNGKVTPCTYTDKEKAEALDFLTQLDYL